MTAPLQLRYERRPWTLNVERQGNRWKRAALVKEWRAEFARLAAGTARFDAIHVLVQPELKNRAAMPDTGACIGAAKAAIDGLVDAGVIAGDGPAIVRRLTFAAPTVTGVDALVLTVVNAELAEAGEECVGRGEHVRLAHRAQQAETMAEQADARCAEALGEATRLGRELDQANRFLSGRPA